MQQFMDIVRSSNAELAFAEIDMRPRVLEDP
jgi:hypothetical protein